MEELQPLYVSLASEVDDPQVTVISSQCMNCHEMGTTRLLMTRIPHLKEVILTSFECEHCGERNTGCQMGRWQEKGVRYQLQVRDERDLSRQVVKSGEATVCIPEVELEIPPNKEKGEVTTVEGILRRTMEGLNQDQSARRLEDPDTALRIENFIDEIERLLTPGQHFTIIIDDPTGNSFLENPKAPKEDPQLKRTVYKRTKEQNEILGIADEEEEDVEESTEINRTPEGEEEESELSLTEETTSEAKDDPENLKDDPENIKDEVLVFSTLCDRCSRPASTNMKVTKIPHFKEVIIMATSCEGCGNRSNEVKSGGGVEKLGRRITLKVKESYDLARDVLKSETCELSIPELDLVVGGGLIGGKFTTLEGLLKDIKEDLESNPFLTGDSSSKENQDVVENLVYDLHDVIKGKRGVTFIMDDPAGNNYVQNLYAPDDDPQLTIEEYERTYEQNEELGLNDMKTENYEEEAAVIAPPQAS
ncbi:zinc finger protein ZPR1-like [Portunus trituberculatus]|uniref:zinc finger protein ZPR1-like n=1 Tax=Portunus trituberculatus TaxID=210409 RepID=UPI001E1D1C83|nr:zinc finger protein ZPR1-like [Portunus trituberculatus]